jgi:hypothetical protein
MEELMSTLRKKSIFVKYKRQKFWRKISVPSSELNYSKERNNYEASSNKYLVLARHII